MIPLAGVQEDENTTSLHQGRTAEQLTLEEVGVQLVRGKNGDVRWLGIQQVGEGEVLHPLPSFLNSCCKNLLPSLVRWVTPSSASSINPRSTRIWMALPKRGFPIPIFS